MIKNQILGCRCPTFIHYLCVYLYNQGLDSRDETHYASSREKSEKLLMSIH